MTFGIFTVTFVFVSFLIVIPPQELCSLGLTIDGLISSFVLSEASNFIQFNILRIAATKNVHFGIPFAFYMLVAFQYPEKEVFSVFTNGIQGKTLESVFWAVYGVVSLFVMCGSILLTIMDEVRSHQTIVLLLGKFALHLRLASWLDVGRQVNDEYQQLEKFSSMLTGWNARTIVTQNWIIRVGQYQVDLAHQDACRLEVTRADNHSLSQQGDVTGSQYITIKVSSHVAGTEQFFLRINAREFGNLKQHVRTPVHVPMGIVIHKSLAESFIEEFRQQVAQNARFPRQNIRGEIENCIGCYNIPAEIKLDKACQVAECLSCGCRPMWCLTCMGLWFAHQQDQQAPETWMQGSAPCPSCRSRFCLLDVCLLTD